jgi:hypothetical protein
LLTKTAFSRSGRESRERPDDEKGGSDIVNLSGVAVVDAQQQEDE